MENPVEPNVGKRERNRLATRQRIAEAALILFEQRGYDSATLEEVARAAGISPRTLFHYFRTKDELIDVFRSAEFDGALAQCIRERDPGEPPLRVLRDCLLDLVARFDAPEAARIDRLLNSTESLRVRKQQVFANWERIAAKALDALYADGRSATELANAAMIGIGALRLALIRRRESAHAEPLVAYLNDQFAGIGQLGGF